MSDALSYAFGEPRVSGRIRTHAGDFRVDEISALQPDGEGEHLLVQLRKTSANTDWVAGCLADALGIARREVSYAGRKDRHAITSQWFSARLIGDEPPGWTSLLPDSVELLASHRHRRKLRRGTLAGNAFRIVVRDLAGEADSLRLRAGHLRGEGVPNYFGEQRFGRDGGNVSAAREMFAGGRRRIARGRREMLLSAARSHIFNAVLARRVADATWNQLLPGDIAELAGSHSIFAVAEADDALRARMLAHDIHPTGPLWGRGEPGSQGDVLALEARVAARHPDLVQGLEAAGLKQARRRLRLSVPDLQVDLSDNCAELRFTLAPGSYATSVLRELLRYEDASVAATESVMESVQ